MPARFFTWLRRAAMLFVDVAKEQSFRFRRERRRQQQFIQQVLSTSNAANDRRLIVSLSTLPDRIGGLQPTLESLLAQTRLPDEIVLAIPKLSVRQKRNYMIPNYLATMHRVRVLQTDTDWGPATKFIPVIRDELKAGRPDTLIMVADDDRIYPRDSVALYLHYSAQLPNAALCFRGGPIARSRDLRRHCKIILGIDLQSPKRAAVMTGCGSYLIQPRFFDEALWDYSAAPKGAFYMDDIWISGCLDRRGVEKYVVPASRMMRTALRQFGTMTLHDVPNGRRHSNNETIEFFSSSWNIFSSR
jgi:hypothetical protein